MNIKIIDSITKTEIPFSIRAEDQTIKLMINSRNLASLFSAVATPQSNQNQPLKAAAVNTTEIVERDANSPIKREAPIPQEQLEFFIDTIPLKYKDEELSKLRTKYFVEKKEMFDKPGGCTSCQQGALMRKYLALIKPIYQKYSNQ